MRTRSRSRSTRRSNESPAWTVRGLKFVFALVLLPLCVGSAQTIVSLVQSTGEAYAFWVTALAGAACWVVIYLTLPKPMWVYVFGHELTHVLWTWLFGGKVKRFKATSKGGHVVVTRTNFLIALAPYFFPVYAVCVVMIFSMGHWLWDWSAARVWFHLLLGTAYAFHVTLTWCILKNRQTDIEEQGYLFSAVVIWLGNASVLIVGIPLLTDRVGVWTALGWCLGATGRVFQPLSAFH